MVAVPATRNSILLPLLGVSFEHTILYHRWLGYLVLATTSLHVIVTWVQWGTSTPSISIATQTFQQPVYLYGFFAWLCIIVMFIFALSYFRRRKFNLFQRTHYLFIAFYTLAGLHSAVYVPRTLAKNSPQRPGCCELTPAHF